MSQCVQLCVLILFVILASSFLNIVMPILVPYYQSIYFIILMTSLQFVIVFGIGLAVMTFKYGFKPQTFQTIKLFAAAGVSNGLMSTLMIYSVDPTRTPILIQVILSCTLILPSVLFTKIILKKQISYVKKFIASSLLCLALSIILSIIPLSDQWEPMAGMWITLYLLSIFFRALYNILQEKYFVVTATHNLNNFENKIILVFYSRLFQLLTVLCCFWMEYILGFKIHNPITSFTNSFVTFGTDLTSFLLMEGFVVVYFVSFLLNVYLNKISTNYNMISASAAGTLTVTFFTIFPSLNKGDKFPMEYVVPCLLLNIISVGLWVKGEKKPQTNLIILAETIPLLQKIEI